jgi:hypothetical protein
LQLRALSFDNCGGRSAGNVEDGVEGLGYGGDVVLGYTEGGRCKTNLGDEVVHLWLPKIHELVYISHRGSAVVGLESGHSLHAASQEASEELI